jgi:hypothetical protein
MFVQASFFCQALEYPLETFPIFPKICGDICAQGAPPVSLKLQKGFNWSP